jgi:hypothetical protein
MTDDQNQGSVSVKSFTMLEWGVVASLLISIGGFVFSAGYLYGQVQADSLRIDTIEKTVRPLEISLAEIRANVQFLKDRADEDRKARQ